MTSGRWAAPTVKPTRPKLTTIVENILSCQYSCLLRVVAFNAAEGWACDVTEDIAHAVLSKVRSEHRSIGIAAQEFLVRVLGVGAPTGD